MNTSTYFKDGRLDRTSIGNGHFNISIRPIQDSQNFEMAIDLGSVGRLIQLQPHELRALSEFFTKIPDPCIRPGGNTEREFYAKHAQ